MDLSNIQVGFLGAGHFGQSLIKSFLNVGVLKPSQIICSNRSHENLEKVKGLGVGTVTTDHTEMLTRSDVIVVAVHPTAVVDVLRKITSHEHSSKSKLIVSVAAGAKIADIEQAVPHHYRVIRLLPNLPSMVCAGASLFAPGRHVTDEDNKLVHTLFSSIGICEKGKEEHIDIVSTLVTPVFGYLVVESMADGAVKMGLPRSLATKLSAQAVLGAAKLVLETGKTPGQLKEEVCSPGGVTVTALHSLEQEGLRATMMNAIEKGTLHAKRMADK